MAIIGACFFASGCAAQTRTINIPPGELETALESIARQADVELIFQPDQVKGIHTDGVVGIMTARQATEKLLEGTRLQLRTDPDNGAMMIGKAPAVGAPRAAQNARNAQNVELTAEEEVIVSARRTELSAMRDEMVRLEDRFYSEYNRLNSNHWWDVLCRWETPSTGGRIRYRVCRPRFVEQTSAGSPGVSDFGIQSGSPPSPAYGGPAPPINRDLILKKWADYEANMLAQINSSPELRRLVSERETLQKRYDEARRQTLKGKILVLD